MKKILIIFSIFALFLATEAGARQANAPDPVQAQEKAGQAIVQDEAEEIEVENENNIETTENEEAEATAIAVPIRAQAKAQNIQELREMIQARKQEIKNETEQKQEKLRPIYQNQNRVREAVHAMLAMEDLTGGIGQEISQIAQEFNNSLETTIQAEEKIRTRNKVLQFFFGGNQKSAEEIDQEISQNQNRIKKLKELHSDCDCEEELKSILGEEIEEIEKEQERLQELVVKEKQNKGFFGTILSWFK